MFCLQRYLGSALLIETRKLNLVNFEHVVNFESVVNLKLRAVTIYGKKKSR